MSESQILKLTDWVLLVVGPVGLLCCSALLTYVILWPLVPAVRPLFRRSIRTLDEMTYAEVLFCAKLVPSMEETKSGLDEAMDQLYAPDGEISNLERRLLIAPIHDDACVLWAGVIARTFLPLVVGETVGRTIPLRAIRESESCELRIIRISCPAILLPHKRWEFTEGDAPEGIMSAVRRELPNYILRAHSNTFREVRVRPGAECVVFGVPHEIQRSPDGRMLVRFESAVVFPGTLPGVRFHVALRALILLSLLGFAVGWMLWFALLTASHTLRQLDL